jgi:hypothetical protein
MEPEGSKPYSYPERDESSSNLRFCLIVSNVIFISMSRSSKLYLHSGLSTRFLYYPLNILYKRQHPFLLKSLTIRWAY